MTKAMKYRFNLAGKKHCSIQSVTIKETSGHDEENAAVQAKAKGGVATAFEELVRLSICEVDGKPSDQPFLEWDHWNSKTRSLVLQAFRSINSIEDKELDFLEGASLQEG